MSWISIIIFAIKYLPDAIKILKEIFDYISELRDSREAKLEIKKLRQNVMLARRRNDFSPLESQLQCLRKMRDK